MVVERQRLEVLLFSLLPSPQFFLMHQIKRRWRSTCADAEFSWEISVVADRSLGEGGS